MQLLFDLDLKTQIWEIQTTINRIHRHLSHNPVSASTQRYAVVEVVKCLHRLGRNIEVLSND